MVMQLWYHWRICRDMQIGPYRETKTWTCIISWNIFPEIIVSVKKVLGAYPHCLEKKKTSAVRTHSVWFPWNLSNEFKVYEYTSVFFRHFCKGEQPLWLFDSFLKPLQNRVYSLRKEFAPGEQILFFKCRPQSKREANKKMVELLPLKILQALTRLHGFFADSHHCCSHHA